MNKLLGATMNRLLEIKLKKIQDEMVNLKHLIDNTLDVQELQLLQLELKGVSIEENALRFRLLNKGIYVMPSDEFINLFVK